MHGGKDTQLPTLLLSFFTFPYLLQRILNRKEKIIPLSSQLFLDRFFYQQIEAGIQR
jgi:hypothetical protein